MLITASLLCTLVVSPVQVLAKEEQELVVAQETDAGDSGAQENASLPELGGEGGDSSTVSDASLPNAPDFSDDSSVGQSAQPQSDSASSEIFSDNDDSSSTASSESHSPSTPGDTSAPDASSSASDTSDTSASASSSDTSASSSASASTGASTSEPEEDEEEDPLLATAEDILLLAATDGAAAAELLNQYPDDAEFETILRQILDLYYTEALPDQLVAFSAAVDARADVLLARYATAAAERAEAAAQGYAAGEVVLLFKAGVSEGEAAAALDALEAQSTGLLDVAMPQQVATVEIPLDQTMEEALAQYAQNPAVDAAQPDYILTVAEEAGDESLETEALSVNDPYAAKQWHLNKVGTEGAWNTLQSASPGGPVRVAVIDTTPDTNHPDLTGSILHDYAIDLQDAASPAPLDVIYGSHGTHVTGIIAATANNSIGVTGVASGPSNGIVEVLPINVGFNEKNMYTSSVVAGINWAMEYGADVINLSLGSYSYNTALAAAVAAATAEGIVVVCAAGNDNKQDAHYPSDYPEAIGVISVDNYTSATANSKSSFSNYGAAKDLSAPGASIYSTTAVTGTGSTGYGSMSGTSMAAPVVTGVVAMMLYVNPGLTPEAVRQILNGTATDLYTPGFDIYTGNGQVNAAAAVAAAAGGPATPLTGLSLSSGTLALAYTKTATLTATLTPRHTTETIRWSSSDESVATVSSSGVVTARGPGTATITVTASGGKIAACEVTVSIGGITNLAQASKTLALSWTAATGVSDYFIYRKAAGETNFTLVDTASFTGKPTWTDPARQPGTQYTYRIVPFVTVDGKVFRGPATEQAFDTGLAAPQNVTVVSANPAGVSLAWDAVAGADGYNIYVHCTAWGGTEYKHAGSSLTNSFTDTSSDETITEKDVELEPGQSYSYIIIAYANSPSMIGAQSTATAAVTIAYQSPGGLAADAAWNQVALRWKAAPGAVGYKIYRAASGGQHTLLATISDGATLAHVDSTVLFGTDYSYQITALYGSPQQESAASAAVSAAPRLAAPENFAAIAASGAVQLSWTPAPDAQGYTIYRSATPMGAYAACGSVSGGGTASLTLRDQGTGGYYYKISSWRTVSLTKRDGSLSDAAFGAGLALSTPVVSGVETLASGYVRATVTSADPATGYIVYVSTSGPGGPYEYHKRISYKSGGSTLLFHPAYGVNYHLRVTAYAEVGADKILVESDASEPFHAYARLAKKPSITATGTQDDYIRVSFTANGGALHGIYRSESPTTGFELVAVRNPFWGGAEYRDDDVACGVTYYYKILPMSAAANGAGASFTAGTQYSDVASATLPASGKAPTGLAARSGADGIALRWNRRASAGGYTVYRSIAGANSFTALHTTANGRTTSYTDATAAAGQSYDYKVAGLYGSPAAPGAESAVVTAMARPAAPTGLMVSDVDGSTATLKWDAVPGADSYAIYSSTQRDDGYTRLVWDIAGGGSPIYSLTGLDGSVCYYKVSASVSAGGGIESSLSAPVAAGPPTLGAPQNLRVGENTASGIQLVWDTVPGAEGYALYRSTSQTGGYTLVATRAYPHCVDTGIDLNESYYYRVAAYTLDGDAKIYSNWCSPRAAQHSYQPTTAVNFTTTDTSLTLRWDAQPGYVHLLRSTQSSGGYEIIASLYGASSFEDTGLSPGVTYYYKLAYVAHPSRMPSASATCGPFTKATAAAAPTGLAANVSGITANLSWAQVAGASGYNVYRSQSRLTGYTLLASPTAAGYADATLTMGVTYYYKVSANFGGVESALSQAVSATGSFVGAANLAAQRSGADGVKLIWNKVGSPDGFYIYRAPRADGSGRVYVGATTGTQYTESGLSTHTDYNSATHYYTLVPYITVDGREILGDTLATSAVTVPIVVTSVTLSPRNKQITAGTTLTIKATTLPAIAADHTVTWTSSDSLIATVSGGVVTAVRAGRVTITATAASGKEASTSVTVTPVSGWFTLDGKTYYYQNSVKYNGWLTYNSKKYYFDQNGIMKTNSWITAASGNRCYVGSNGIMKTDSWITAANGNRYYVGSNGVMKKNYWVTAASGNRCYVDSNGIMKKNSWITTGNNRYYVGSNGVMKKNTWITTGNNRYYVGNNGVMKKNSWIITGGNRYYVGNNGVMKKNSWIVSDGNRYYVGSNGVMKKNSWITTNGNRYYVGNGGAMRKNSWVTTDSKRYYVGSSGVMRKNSWLTLNEKKYYFNTSGVMQTGRVNINGVWHQFASTGVWQKQLS